MEEKRDSLNKFVSELKQASISLDNFESKDERVISSSDIIGTTLDSNAAKLKELQDEIKKIKETDEHKNNESDGLISKRLGELYIQCYNLIHNSFMWSILESAMYKTMSDKKSECLKEQKGMSIKKDTLIEFREDLKQRDAFMKDLFTNKVAAVEEKFDGTIKLLQKENHIEREQHLHTMKDMMLLLKTVIDNVKTELPENIKDQAIKKIKTEIEEAPVRFSEEINKQEPQISKNTREVPENKTTNEQKTVKEEEDSKLDDDLDDVEREFSQL